MIRLLHLSSPCPSIHVSFPPFHLSSPNLLPVCVVPNRQTPLTNPVFPPIIYNQLLPPWLCEGHDREGEDGKELICRLCVTSQPPPSLHYHLSSLTILVVRHRLGISPRHCIYYRCASFSTHNAAVQNIYDKFARCCKVILRCYHLIFTVLSCLVFFCLFLVVLIIIPC